MRRGFCLSTGMNFMLSYYLQIFRHYWIAMLTSAAGCLNSEISVLRETYFARAFVYDTKIISLKVTFVN
jgi:hypothetical protein